MPNFVDNFIITVLTFYPATIQASAGTPGNPVDPGTDVIYSIAYRSGYPPATGWDVEWLEEGSLSLDPPTRNEFTPALPIVPATPQAGDSLQTGHLISRAPSNPAPPIEGATTRAYTGRITIYQADFDRNTGMVI